MIDPIALVAAVVLRIAAMLPLLSPPDASAVAPHLVGAGRFSDEVVSICRVESRCRPIGIHRGRVERVDGERFYRQAIRRSIIDPLTCAAHDGKDMNRWGIRGPHGHAAAYAVRYLGPCLAPEMVDVPMVSAMIVALRLREFEVKFSKRTNAERAHAWRHGVGCRCKEER